MFINNKILIGKNEKTEANILLNMANRHGLITGASGSGKTITLKVLAESFSAAGVPVFMVDVKGDLAATSQVGESNPNVSERITNLNLENFIFQSFPVTYLDVYGKNGHPIRTTVSNIGSRLLGRMLNLTEAQEGVLAIVFKIAEDEKLELIDLKDLQKVLTYVGEKRKEYSLTYGNVTSQSIGAIQRNLLVLESEGGDYFFGNPAFQIKDLIHYDNNDGRGFINILDAQELFKKPTFYASFLLWLLTEIYNTLPEVGDPIKPKLVFFFDEAHLLFSEMPEYLIKNVIQIVKLIRSKGVGLYFISQSPSDIPDEVLAQLGNRVQHVLRSYTKTDEKAIKAAADSFRTNPLFDTEDAIRTLKTGEALVSFQEEDGAPTIVEKVTILPPQSKMGTLDDLVRHQIIKASFLYNKYEIREEQNSAFEKLNNKKSLNYNKPLKKSESKLEKYADKLATKTVNTIGRKLGNKIFKLFK